MPNEIIGPLTALGLPGIIILMLGWALVRKDKQVETLQDCRVTEQKTAAAERAADNLRAASIIESLNEAARVREEASDSRWRIMEQIGEGVKTTAKALEAQVTELGRATRVADGNALRLERIEQMIDRVSRQ